MSLTNSLTNNRHIKKKIASNAFLRKNSDEFKTNQSGKIEKKGSKVKNSSHNIRRSNSIALSERNIRGQQNFGNELVQLISDSSSSISSESDK